jgi:undecaprenyl-diphosphatase
MPSGRALRHEVNHGGRRTWYVASLKGTPAGVAPDGAAEGSQAGVPCLPGNSRRLAAAIALSSGLAFAIVAIWIGRSGHTVPAVDRQLHNWVLRHRPGWSTEIARTVRWGGLSYCVLPALALIGTVAARDRKVIARAWSGLCLTATAGAGIYVEIRINSLIDRPRPPVADWAGAAAGPAFPSGHTTAAALFAVSCAWALMARFPAGPRRRAVWAGAAAYVAIIGWSRIWLGVHWPTDVLGACLYGVAWMSIAMAVMPRRHPAADAQPE